MSELKYKVGDKVRIKSLDWYHENKNHYGEILLFKQGGLFVPDMSRYCNNIMTIKDICYGTCYRMKEDFWNYNWTDEMIEGLVEEESKKEVIAWIPNGKLIAEKFNDGAIMAIIDKFKYNKLPINSELCNDKVELVISPDFELKQEGDTWFAVKKKNEYPKTYEECCKILGCKPIVGFAGLDDEEENLYGKFIALKRCRDAYWKLYGEEMGLGKSWEPDWNNVSDKYCIYFVSGYAWSKECQTRQCPFAFPTKEMRDAFKENFGPDIEICKELL